VIKIKDKLLWDYLDGKLSAHASSKVNRLIGTDKAIEKRFKRICALNELIKDDLCEHITPAPEDIAEGVRAKWNSAGEINEAVSEVNNSIMYVFLGVVGVLIVFGSTVFKGVLKQGYVDYPAIGSMDPFYVYAVLVSVTVVILSIMVFDLAVGRNV
jgi:hypothetical protein